MEQDVINKNVCAVVIKAIREDMSKEDSLINKRELSRNDLVNALQYTIIHISNDVPLKL